MTSQQSNDSQLAVQEELPLAMVDGQPITEIPKDLYIPPDALSVILEIFEGPLDLLLYLIRRQNMDILALNVAEITRQYMDYVTLAQSLKLELAAEYLLMAAMLAEIKSRMLLPKPATDEDAEEDPRAELIRRLQQYERFKQAGEDIDRLPRMHRESYGVQVHQGQSQVMKPQPEVSLAELVAALNGVLARSELFEHHHITKERLSTRERMSRVMDAVKEGRFVSFYQLFSPHEGRDGVVVTFLAIMELVKEQLIELVQAEVFAPIHVKAKEAAFVE